MVQENTAAWPIEEREQGERFEEKCEEMGGEPYVTSRQLQCQVGDKELRVDKKRGIAVLESRTERIGIIRDANYIEGDSEGIKVSNDLEDTEESIRLKSQRNLRRSQKTDFEDKLVLAPEDMRPNR